MTLTKIGVVSIAVSVVASIRRAAMRATLFVLSTYARSSWPGGPAASAGCVWSQKPPVSVRPAAGARTPSLERITVPRTSLSGIVVPMSTDHESKKSLPTGHAASPVSDLVLLESSAGVASSTTPSLARTRAA